MTEGKTGGPIYVLSIFAVLILRNYKFWRGEIRTWQQMLTGLIIKRHSQMVSTASHSGVSKFTY